MKKIILPFICLILFICFIATLLSIKEDKEILYLKDIPSSFQGKGEIQDLTKGRSVSLDETTMGEIFDRLKEVKLTKVNQEKEVSWLYFIKWENNKIDISNNGIQVNGIRYKTKNKDFVTFLKIYLEFH